MKDRTSRRRTHTRLQPRRREAGYSLAETLVVVALIGVVSAIAVPMMGNEMLFLRISGDARGLWNTAAVAKMRAASEFSRVRVYVDLSANSYHIDSWNTTTSQWVTEGGTTSLSSSVNFGFGVVGSAPPNTQATIGQAAQCVDNSGNAIGNTACVIFNSRGLPVDSTSAPTASDAVYVTDGTVVYGITVGATGMVKLWHTPPTATPSWVTS